MRRCPSTSAPLLLGCLLRENELVIGSVELGPLPMHLTVGLPALKIVLSQNSIFGQNPKIGYQEFNDLQTPKLSKKQLCDRTRFYHPAGRREPLAPWRSALTAEGVVRLGRIYGSP